MGLSELFELSETKNFLCTRCLETIKPKSVVKGSFIVERALAHGRDLVATDSARYPLHRLAPHHSP
jgi:hypothetical protein